MNTGTYRNGENENRWKEALHVAGFSLLSSLLVALFILVAWFATVAKANERENIIETLAKIKPSIGALYAQEESGDMSFLCSATAVGRHDQHTIILTAYHCLKKGVSYMINFGDNKLRPLKVWKVPHYEVSRKDYPRKFNEPETDMAMFLMQGTDVPVVPMADHSRVETGTKIAMVGYPLGVARISYEGIVAGRFNRLGSDQYDYTLLQIFGAPGSSGSAVVSAESGKVISILVSAKQDRAGLPVLFATPIEYRRHLMKVRPEERNGVGSDKETPNG